MANYSTRDTVKTYLGIPGATTSEDDAIDAALDAAEARIDAWTGRTFVIPGAATGRVFRPWSSTILYIDDAGTTSGFVVKEDRDDDGVYETTLTGTTDYYLHGQNQAPFREVCRVGGVWPQPRSGRPSVEVTAIWCYDQTGVPEQITQAATILGARYYQRRSSPLGFQAGLSPEFGVARVSRMDPDVEGLLSGFRLPAVA